MKVEERKKGFFSSSSSWLESGLGGMGGGRKWKRVQKTGMSCLFLLLWK